MNRLIRLCRLCAALLLLLSGLASAVQAYTVTGNLPVQGYLVPVNWDTVVQDATAQSKPPSPPGDPNPVQGGTPIYHSTSVEEVIFEGDFTADDTTTNLALYSDDGADFSIGPDKDHMTKIWGDKGVTHALENLPASLHLLPITLTAGQTYHIKIDYTNVIHYGDADIDGCTLFAFDNAPIVTFTGGLTNGVIRACAGAVADPVHKATVTLHATLTGASAGGLSVGIAFDSSVDYTGCQPPRLLDDQNQNNPVSTLTRTTDANGNISVTVLSSNLISTPASMPNLIVTYQSNQIGSVGCDFDTDWSKRRYGILTYDPRDGYGTDTGWDFDSYSLINPGDTADAIVFLKFQKDPSVQIDPNYYLSSLSLVSNTPIPSLDVDGDGEVSDDEYYAGTIRGDALHPLNDANNWLAVSGHTVHVRITQITDLDTGQTIQDPATIQQYICYVDSNGQPILNPSTGVMTAFVTATTDANGSVTVHMQAGPLIDSLGDVTMDIVDETQLDKTGTGNF